MGKSKRVVCADWHLGHENITEFRPQFSSAEEHHEVMFDVLASSVNPRDTLYMLGDMAFNHYWLERISQIKCKSKVLLLGNHDPERGVSIIDIGNAYDKVYSLLANRNIWWSHAPIHPSDFRSRKANIHGHDHAKVLAEPGYFCVSAEQINYRPITFADIMERIAAGQNNAIDNHGTPTFINCKADKRLARIEWRAKCRLIPS